MVTIMVTKFPRKHLFEVYVYLDPRNLGPFYYGHWKFDYEPFYVGKGHGDRCNTHLKIKKNNSHKNNKILKLRRLGLKPIVVIKRMHLTEKQAFKLEKRLIKIIGRADLGLGPLCNHTDGGDGISGHVHNKKTRKKMRENHKGMTGKTPSLETREKMSKAMKGKVRSVEGRANISKAVKKLWSDPLYRKHMSKTHKGYIPSEESNRKRAKALKGRKRPPFSKEWCKNLSIGQLKNPSRGMLGKKHSESAKRKMRKTKEESRKLRNIV
jgi:hypothetical protein